MIPNGSQDQDVVHRVGYFIAKCSWAWGPAWVMMVLIFAISSVSTLPAGSSVLDDGVWHAITYGALAASLLRGVAVASWSGVTSRKAFLAGLFAVLYGVTDELHQRFVPGRVAEFSDLAADAVGAMASVFLLWCWRSFVQVSV